jgi:CheY-like chemotaxis protein
MTQLADSNVRRLQPLRVLVASRDRRFLRVTSFLLSRRGYSVTRAAIAEAREAAERDRPDVVLVELDGSRVEAGRAVAALQASLAAPAVLLLSENGTDGWHGLPSLAKWTPIEELAPAIERAALHRLPPAMVEGETTSL